MILFSSSWIKRYWLQLDDRTLTYLFELNSAGNSGFYPWCLPNTIPKAGTSCFRTIIPPSLLSLTQFFLPLQFLLPSDLVFRRFLLKQNSCFHCSNVHKHGRKSWLQNEISEHGNLKPTGGQTNAACNSQEGQNERNIYQSIWWFIKKPKSRVQFCFIFKSGVYLEKLRTNISEAPDKKSMHSEIHRCSSAERWDKVSEFFKTHATGVKTIARIDLLFRLGHVGPEYICNCDRHICREVGTFGSSFHNFRSSNLFCFEQSESVPCGNSMRVVNIQVRFALDSFVSSNLYWRSLLSRAWEAELEYRQKIPDKNEKHDSPGIARPVGLGGMKLNLHTWVPIPPFCGKHQENKGEMRRRFLPALDES